MGVEVTAGNVHDSVAWDKVYDEVTRKHNVQFVTMDAGYKTPWIAKKTSILTHKCTRTRVFA